MEKSEYAAAYAAGFADGLGWEGPNGDGSLGALSLEFIREMAERWACGYTFDQLVDGPSDGEMEAAQWYMRGHYDGRSAGPPGEA